MCLAIELWRMLSKTVFGDGDSAARLVEWNTLKREDRQFLIKA